MKNISTLAIILMVVSSCCLVSCNSDSYSSTDSESNHCSITSLVLGTLTREVHTTLSSGKDSTYNTTFSGSLYNMYIDQYKNEIYNPDSLPVGTFVDKIVFASYACDGSMGYANDTLAEVTFSTSDTLDFTKPRTFMCYSYSGKGKRTYTVRVNVHQVNSETFQWFNIQEANATLQTVTNQKAFCKGDQLYVFANTPTGAVLTNTKEGDKTTWETTPLTLTNLIPQSILLYNDEFYTVQNQQIVKSNNGIDWVNVNTTFIVDALVAQSSSMMFAQKDGEIYYSANGITWQKDTIESAADKLPTNGYTSVYMPMSFNENFEYVLLGGTLNGKNVEWKKTIDNKGNNTEPWSLYFAPGMEYQRSYPDFAQLQMVKYDNRIYALGIENDTLSLFRQSTDGGNTWLKYTTTYLHPANIAATNFSMVVDDEKYLWLICGGSGAIWRGRINRMGFATNQTSFTE